MRFIRAHACEGIRVEDALDEVACSRSTIQRRFRALIGRSPKAEITRVQLEPAKQLLAQTDLSVAAVAQRCGFAELKRLGSVFRAKVGLSPMAYRRERRAKTKVPFVPGTFGPRRVELVSDQAAGGPSPNGSRRQFW